MDWTRVLDRPSLEQFHEVQVPAFALDFVALPADPVDDRLATLENDGEQPGQRKELWLGSAAGEPVAAGGITISRHDNLDEAEIELCVTPAARGRGYGAAAAQLLLGRCRELGRTRAVVQVPTGLDGEGSAGDRLAARCGFSARLAEVRRLLDVRAVDLGALDRLARTAEESAVGYALTPFVDRVPDVDVAGLAALAGRMSTDAPRGELSHEAEVWDAARWRAREDDAVRRGRLHVGAYATRDGEVVAYTDLGVARTRPEVGYQWDTLVRADHRGHRLGLLLKVFALDLLRAESPATRWVNTWNAASNVHMIAINEAMGFRAVDAWSAWQRTL